MDVDGELFSLQELSSKTLFRTLSHIDERVAENEEKLQAWYKFIRGRDIPLRTRSDILDEFTSNYVEMCKKKLVDGQQDSVPFSFDDLQMAFLPSHVIRLVAIPHTTADGNEQDRNLTKLDLTKLKKLGVMSEFYLDLSYQALSESLVNMASLTEIHLATVRKSTGKGVTSRFMPSIKDEQLGIIGLVCRKLEYLDVSCNDLLTHEGLEFLLPGPDRQGCPLIKQLHVFECMFTHRFLAGFVVQLQHLMFLGYKETGKIAKFLYTEAVKKGMPVPVLNITHVNNQGSKNRGIIPSGLRCKKIMSEAISHVTPKATNLKLRVTDNDVGHLQQVESATSLELIYNFGIRNNVQGPQSELFFRARGANLTTLAVISDNASLFHLNVLGENCPNLVQLWLRYNTFNNTFSADFEATHDYFRKLEILYFRVGENNLKEVSLSVRALHFLLCRASRLTRLELIMREKTLMTHDCIGKELLLNRSFSFHQLKKILLAIPAKNDTAAVFSELGPKFLTELLDKRPSLVEVANVITWNVSEEDLENIQKRHEGVRIVRRKVTLK